MKPRASLYPVCICILLLVTKNIPAQQLVTRNQQAEILKDLCEKLERYYTRPETGDASSKLIAKKFENGGFPENVTPGEFSEAINRDLLDVSHDVHLKIMYDPDRARALRETGTGEDLTDPEIQSERWRNFGFNELKILDGNIGYLKLTDFSSVRYAGERAVTAMHYFSDCNALIIDLRQNGGGSDNMVVFLAGYFIDSAEPVLFNISYSTIDSSYYASMSPSYIPGKKFIDIPVYIMTSEATASAAEAFTNILKSNNRNVTIVGGKTRGAENPVHHLPIAGDYVLRIPSWRSIYSSTKTGWEGVGISPDIEVGEEKAHATAHLEALTKLLKGASDPDEISRYQWAYDGVKAMRDPVTVAKNILRSYEGRYRGGNIVYENGALYYGRERKRLIPISESYFLVESREYFRIRFIVENGETVALDRIFIYGYSSRHSRE